MTRSVGHGRPRRYPSGASDAEWQIAPAYLPAGGTGARSRSPAGHLPAPGHRGRHRVRRRAGLREQVRIAEGRAASPSAAATDFRSVLAAKTVPPAHRQPDESCHSKGSMVAGLLSSPRVVGRIRGGSVPRPYSGLSRSNSLAAGAPRVEQPRVEQPGVGGTDHRGVGPARVPASE